MDTQKSSRSHDGATSNINPHLKGIVDIGSNGLRFSISSLHEKQARIIPCLFQDRTAISLFDAQHSKSDGENGGSGRNDIPDAVIADVVLALQRFKLICSDFGVADSNVHIVATEATRECSNSSQFRQALQEATGWEVNMLSKEDEARTGVYGVTSSFHQVEGLFLDLGGGSMQLSWISCVGGKFRMSNSPVSLPYGAAALTRRLGKESRESVKAEMVERLSKALSVIEVPEEMSKSAHERGGFKIYVSGGGFRGLGHLLLANKEHGGEVYPLQIINGFSSSGSALRELIESEFLTSAKREKAAKKVFRISERRAAQLPAVALLVSAVLETFPTVRKVLFSQGGVREGVLFHRLPEQVRAMDPLQVATHPYAPVLAHKYAQALLTTVPDIAPHVIRTRIVQALTNVAFVHSSYPKELQPSAGLAIASTGIISGAHGLSHEVRALLGLALCHRWGGELPDTGSKEAMIGVLSTRRLAWWACYCGQLMHVVGGIYPGGTVRGNPVEFSVQNVTNDSFDLVISANKSNVQANAPAVRARINNLEKKLKKLNKEFDGQGLKVKVDVRWV